MESDKFLTIGSVVMLKGGDKRAMIMGYLPIPNNSGKLEMFDYIGCIFPEGIMSLQEILVFNHQQIEKIYSTGYQDKEVDYFKEELKMVERKIKSEGVNSFLNSSPNLEKEDKLS